jgi:aryl-alcohol dehydrogenase-like predicted oxidoreductase
MEYTRLGRSGLKVSRLCLGTMNFGPQAGEADSFAMMDKALELGINFFDTANRYGGRIGIGATEAIIGR